MIRVGVAGWDYRDWAGIVYPKPQRKGFDRLAFLAGYFDTLELDTTFYRPPRAEIAQSWADRVAFNSRFRFTAKLWQRMTHERDTPWTNEEERWAREALHVLAERRVLGAVLAQFPASFRRTDAHGAPLEENLHWLDRLISTFHDYPLVLELRHSSWNDDDVLAEWVERGVGLANIDQPLFRDSLRPAAQATGAAGYVRIHGRNAKQWWSRPGQSNTERYNYLYSAEELRPWVERVKQISANPRVNDTYVVLNNHNFGKAPANAFLFESLFRGEIVEVPPTLFEQYRPLLEGHARPLLRARAEAQPLATQQSLLFDGERR